jgi:dTDP-4-amino-4,6-dideoxygalactose transaminase
MQSQLITTVIEDAAQAHGAIANSNSKFQIQTPKAGNLSDAALVSTWEKSGALGDGGAITTNDSELAKSLRH